MAKLNLTEAAKSVGISRTTLYIHIKEGKISCETNEEGKRVIDTSELIRVYGDLRSDEHASEQSETLVVQVLRDRIGDLEGQIVDLKEDKEASRKREEELLDILKKQQTLLLPSNTTQKTAKKRGFFGRLFGGNS